MKLGIIGLSELGQQHLRFFREYTNHEVLTADTDKALKPNSTFASLAEHADVIFVCDETPAGEDGGLNTSVLEKTIDDIAAAADNCVVVLRFPVPVGFTRKIQLKHANLAIYFVPAFSSGGDPWEDFMHPDFYIFGYVPRADEDKEKQAERAAHEVAHFLPKPNHNGLAHEAVNELLKAMTGQGPVPQQPPENAPLEIMPAEHAELYAVLAGSVDAINMIIARDIEQLAKKAGVDFPPIADLMGLRTEFHAGAARLLKEGRRYARSIGTTLFEIDAKPKGHKGRQNKPTKKAK